MTRVDGTTQGGDGTGIDRSAEELFGAIAEETPPAKPTPTHGPGSLPPGSSGSKPQIEDRTAREVFADLQRTVETPSGADEILADDTPEDIIRLADEPAEDRSVDDDLFDQEAFENLILPGRRKEGEFLWVNTGTTDPSETETGWLQDESRHHQLTARDGSNEGTTSSATWNEEEPQRPAAVAPGANPPSRPTTGRTVSETDDEETFLERLKRRL